MSPTDAARLTTRAREIEYPESDGQPMAETNIHWRATVDLADMLDERYGQQPDVYVASDLFIYYREGEPRAVVAPDVFVVFGVPRGNRRVYKVWEEGAAPQVVVEITSRQTKADDQGRKREVYRKLGVAEYFLYDPEADWLRPPLQGYRLINGAYQKQVARADGALRSHILGLDLYDDGGKLVLTDFETGASLLPPRDRAARAEAEVAALRAELDRLCAGGGGGGQPD